MAAAGGWTARWCTELSAVPLPSPKPFAELATLRSAPSLCECWERAIAQGHIVEGGMKLGPGSGIPWGVRLFTHHTIGKRCRPTEGKFHVHLIKKTENVNT